MDIFIKLKSWQLFVVLFVIPFSFQFSLMSFLIGSDDLDPKIIFNVFPFFMLIFMTLYLSWFWSLGINLNRYVKEEIRPKINRFKFCIIYPAFYAVLFTTFFISASSGMQPSNLFIIIVPLHLLAMFCMLYTLIFIAKNFVMAEKNVIVNFYDYSGPFFLIWFFPIGIWFIQPRVNTLYEKNTKKPGSESNCF